MNDINTVIDTENRLCETAERMSVEVAIMAGRLAGMLKDLFAHDIDIINNAVSYLQHAYQQTLGDTPIATWQGKLRDRFESFSAHPLTRLIRRLGLSDLEIDLLLLAGMAEQHEGFADIFRTLHPQHLSRPTAGLAAQLFCQDATARYDLQERLQTGPLLGAGVIRLEGEGPLFTKSLVVERELWSCMLGINAWPLECGRLDVKPALQGLQRWFGQPNVSRLMGVIREKLPCTIFMTADNDTAAMQRAVALIYQCGLRCMVFLVTGEFSPERERQIYQHCLLRGMLPVLQFTPAQKQDYRLALLNEYPLPVIMCMQHGVHVVTGDRPVLSVLVERLPALDLREMWRQSLPDMADQAATLAARYPLEPAQAQQISRDISLIHPVTDKPSLADVSEIIRARSVTRVNSSVQLIRPLTGWEQLVLPQNKLLQLEEAVNRLYLQAKVLDEWRFLEGRRGARGVRMLFSGPPGTGKTLSAEVMAKSLGVDLLVVDLSRVVSKWIGETEKNLSEVFDVAEDAKAVLLFDEADALFGKRTEVSDAHDRYANLETAYLLSRLERYDGLAILSTNLQQNIDAAFLRRLEFIIDYQEPDREQRLALWKCHIPAGARLAEDVNLEELAGHFAVVGGLIRNAVVAAAFLAAAEDDVIRREHFIHALRREYEKAGKVYRHLPGEIMKTVTGGN